MLDRLDDTRLAVVQAKDAGRSAAGRRRGATTTAAARRERVARSRDRAQGLKSGETTESTETEAVTHMSDADAVAAQPNWEGSALPNEDGSAPDGFEIKGNADSMKYHEPGTRYYNQTVPEVYFDTIENAEAAGFTPTVEEAQAHEDEAHADDAADAESTDAAADDASEEETN